MDGADIMEVIGVDIGDGITTTIMVGMVAVIGPIIIVLLIITIDRLILLLADQGILPVQELPLLADQEIRV